MDKKVCKCCGKELINKNSIYCNHKCQKDYATIEYIRRWKNGKESGMRGKTNISRHIRKYLIEKHNNSCEKCGWDKVNLITGNSPLEIHHIDGDHTNNKEDNLELLCPNCHSLTDTFKSLNNGKGR